MKSIPTLTGPKSSVMLGTPPKGNVKGSTYIDDLRLDYSLYIMKSRGIIAEADGLKTSGRRLLWTARDGSIMKSFNLAAATAPIHPHSTPEGTINTLAAQFINNIPLLEGIQSFGTFVEPHAFSASRYTDVRLSKFTKQVMFADSEIIPMMDNYDQTQKEPFHFLPLVPVSLINPSEGIIIGFSSNILPRKLTEIIDRQIAYLQCKKIKPIVPCSEPSDSCATGQDAEGRWIFEGVVERTAHNIASIVKLPYGVSYDDTVKVLKTLREKELIVDFVDDCQVSIKFEVMFKKGALRSYSDAELLKMFKLTSRQAERIIMLSFKGDTVVDRTFEETISSFCDWRLGWFINRYQYRKDKYDAELQYIKDYLLTVDSGTAAKFTTEKSKDALEATLRRIGVVNDERIARLPAYAFTKAEYDKMMAKKLETEALIKECVAFLKDEQKRRDQYILELKEIQTNYNKGKYSV